MTVKIQRRLIIAQAPLWWGVHLAWEASLRVSEVMECSYSSESIKRLAEQMSAGTLLFFLATDSRAHGLFALVTKEPRNGLPSWLDYIFSQQFAECVSKCSFSSQGQRPAGDLRVLWLYRVLQEISFAWKILARFALQGSLELHKIYNV